MGSVEQEIEYWAVQKATLQIRNNSLIDEIDQIEHDQKVAKDRLKELRKNRDLNKNKMIICEKHIGLLGG
jgi:chromosome segregation ATPase